VQQWNKTVPFFMLTWRLCRALVQGGGLATVLGDDFQDNAMLCQNCTFTGNEATTGGGVYHSGGSNTFAASTFSSNRAQQQGGAIAFQDVCGRRSSADADSSAPTTACSLSVTKGTTIGRNTALVGGGIFVATPGTRGINSSELLMATGRAGGNVAVYSPDLALAPGHDSLALTSYPELQLPAA
jgi:predicted outer membrane repeat protein